MVFWITRYCIIIDYCCINMLPLKATIEVVYMFILHIKTFIYYFSLFLDTSQEQTATSMPKMLWPKKWRRWRQRYWAGRHLREQRQCQKTPIKPHVWKHSQTAAAAERAAWKACLRKSCRSMMRNVGQVALAHKFKIKYRHIWQSKRSHAQTAHSSTGESTKFVFPPWLPLLQSFFVLLVPVLTVRDCSV